MWICKMCGAENADGAIFCKDCGDKHEPEAAGPIVAVPPLDETGQPVLVPPPTSVTPEPPTPGAVGSPSLSPSPPPAPPRAFLLLFDANGNVAEEFPLKEGPNLIGITSVPDDIFPDVDLDAHDPDQIVSRRHAVLTVSGDQFLLEDQRSTNGTWVNGQRLKPHQPQQLLHSDDIVFSQRVRARFVVR